MPADTWAAASTICRAASVLYGPYCPDRFPQWELAGAETVVLPEPDQLARLLAASRRWRQPALFDTGAV